jgi:nicotinic acid phosphoribosyltransferase
MIPTALYDDSKQIVDTMYNIDRQWMSHHPGLGILLPDTYGTSYYLNNCPEDIALSHNGCRFDSKNPLEGIPEYNAFLNRYDRDPRQLI